MIIYRTQNGNFPMSQLGRERSKQSSPLLSAFISGSRRDRANASDHLGLNFFIFMLLWTKNRFTAIACWAYDPSGKLWISKSFLSQRIPVFFRENPTLTFSFTITRNPVFYKFSWSSRVYVVIDDSFPLLDATLTF